MTEWKLMFVAVLAIFVGSWVGTGLVMALAWLHRRYG